MTKGGREERNGSSERIAREEPGEATCEGAVLGKGRITTPAGKRERGK